jgi:hypothetical protein
MEKRIFFDMNGNYDDRFDVEELRKVIEPLDNGSFKKIVFEYQAVYAKFVYKPEFNELGHTSNYNSFVTAVQNCIYREFFRY